MSSIQFLKETADEYDSSTMQKSLLFIVVEVLEAVKNDIDLMTDISIDLSNIGQSMSFRS